MRSADPVADRILETLRMAREVGGTELTTVLRSLASYLREDAAVRAELGRASHGSSTPPGWESPRRGSCCCCSPPARRPRQAYNTPAGSVVILGGLLVSMRGLSDHAPCRAAARGTTVVPMSAQLGWAIVLGSTLGLGLWSLASTHPAAAARATDRPDRALPRSMCPRRPGSGPSATPSTRCP